MLDIREELTILISSLNIEKFRLLITEYLKEKYSTKEVFIVDGPYDGGNDIEIRKEGKTTRRNVQITVQKSKLEEKIREDLDKSVENCLKFPYTKTLDFYYNQKLTKSQIDNFTLTAELDFDINLAIYDANILAQLSESYPIIKNKTLELLGVNHQPENLEIDRPTKILFDLLSNNKETNEIKKQFAFSYIFTLLYEKPGLTIEEIKNQLITRLPDVSNEKFYRDALSYLKGIGLIATDETKKKFSLSESKKAEIKSTYEKSAIQEGILIEEIQNILKTYGINEAANEIELFLCEAYKINYRIDLEELTTNTFSVVPAMKKIYNDLETFLRPKMVDASQITNLVHRLFDSCSKSEFLNKIGASILFVNLYKSNKLDSYLNNKTQNYYLDTQVLLRIICFQYAPNIYDDVEFKSVANFYESIKQYGKKVALHTSTDYLYEVAGHIQEALRLQRFFELPIFQKDAKSKNVFFNFYRHLENTGYYPDDQGMNLKYFFDDLLDIDLPSFKDSRFNAIVVSTLSDILDFLGIRVFDHSEYENFHMYKKEYETILAYSKSKPRNNIAIDHDLRMILYLSDRNIHKNEFSVYRNEPFLVTWDSLFYNIRKEFINKFKLGYWYIYSPAKLADRLSLMNFKLNPESIDNNIISITESHFNFSSRKDSYLDVISSFFSTEKLSEIKLIHKLMRMEKASQNINEVPEKGDEIDESSPLVNILLEIRKYFNKPESKFKFNQIISVFENELFEETIGNILEENIKYYLDNNKKINPTIYSDLEKMVGNT